MPQQHQILIATYRLPRQRKTEHSEECRMTLRGHDQFTLHGPTGTHTLYADSRTATGQSRVRAHWAGFCSNNCGTTVRPATIRWPKLSTLPHTDR